MLLKQTTLITFFSLGLCSPQPGPLCKAPSSNYGYDWVYVGSKTGVWYTKTEDLVSWEDCPSECNSIQGHWAKHLTQDELTGCEAAMIDWWAEPENIIDESRIGEYRN